MLILSSKKTRRSVFVATHLLTNNQLGLFSFSLDETHGTMANGISLHFTSERENDTPSHHFYLGWEGGIIHSFVCSFVWLGSSNYKNITSQHRSTEYRPLVDDENPVMTTNKPVITLFFVGRSLPAGVRLASAFIFLLDFFLSWSGICTCTRSVGQSVTMGMKEERAALEEEEEKEEWERGCFFSFFLLLLLAPSFMMAVLLVVPSDGVSSFFLSPMLCVVTGYAMGRGSFMGWGVLFFFSFLCFFFFVLFFLG